MVIVAKFYSFKCFKNPVEIRFISVKGGGGGFAEEVRPKPRGWRIGAEGSGRAEGRGA